MTRTDAFAKDMCHELRKQCGLEWEPGKPTTGDRECVDVIGRRGGRRGKVCVLVEVELRRGTPLANVVKVWNQITKEKENGNGRLGKTVVLFQAFSRFYYTKGTRKKGTGRQNAEFVGKQMSDACRPRVHYIPLSMDYSPGKRQTGRPVMQGAGRRKQHAIKLAHRIVARLRKIKL